MSGKRLGLKLPTLASLSENTRLVLLPRDSYLRKTVQIICFHIELEFTNCRLFVQKIIIT